MGAALPLPAASPWGQRKLEEAGAEERYIRDLVEAKDWTRIVELLQASPSYAKQRHAKTGLLPLHWALSRQAPYEVINCLVGQYPESIRENDNDELKRKPLHLAAAYYSKESKPVVLESVLDAAPDLATVVDEEGRLPLHIAASSKASKESITILLDAHPDGASRRTKATKLPLHLACEFRAPLETTSALLAAFPLGAKESSMLKFPLHFACEFKAGIEVVQLLLDAHPDAVFAKAGADTLLPLHLAAANKASPDVIELLLLHNADAVVDRDNNMRLPLHHALERSAPEETIVLLIQTCPETASVQGYFPHLPLHIALEKNYSVVVIDALLTALPSSSQRKDAYGVLPLRRAIKSRSSPEVILSILRDDKIKAATKELDEYERLALHYACARQMPLSVIQALVDACPEGVQVPDKNGQLPLHLSVMRACACSDGATESVLIIQLLVKTFPEAVMTRDNYSYLPLHHAIEIGASEEMYAFLISSDRRCTELRVDGKLPLAFAIETKRSPAIISMILSAFPSAAREPEHEKGRIPLLHAIERRHGLEVLEELMNVFPLECSVVKDNDGRQAAHYCVEHDAPIEIFKRVLSDCPGVVMLKDLDFYFYQASETGRATPPPPRNVATPSQQQGLPLFTRPTTRRPGKQLLHYATEDLNASSLLVEEILMVQQGGLIMPISASTGAVNLHHGHGWTFLLSECNDRYAIVVERILDRYSANAKWVQLLCEAPDELGRPAPKIASPECRKIIMGRLHYFGRYEFFPGPIAHESENSIVRFATDHGSMEGKRTVALKFMKHRDQFDREVNLRSRIKLSEEFIVPALSSHEGDGDPHYLAETRRKGFSEYPFCVVTAACDRDLQTIVQREHIANRDYSRIRQVALHLLQALDHLHENNLIHGDVKPMNAVRVGGRYKLIDLGASVFFGSLAGTVKVSSAYVPPEMVYIPPPIFQHDHAHDDDQHGSDALAPPETAYDQSMSTKYDISSKTGQPVYPRPPPTGESFGAVAVADATLTHKSEMIECIPAHSSIDMWSFGVLLFFVCTGESLLPCSVEDKLDTAQKLVLAKWDDDFKFRRLAKVADPMARNLILQLLSKNPNRRPTARAALQHPFFTLSVAAAAAAAAVATEKPAELPFRFQGMAAKFDVCICYRIVTDRMRARRRLVTSTSSSDGATNDEGMDVSAAQELAQLLSARGLTVCLGSEGGVGLINSKACCILLSRTAVNNEHDATRNLGSIDNEATDVDELFMDSRLAIELTHHGLLEGGVHAVLMGDVVVTVSDDSGGDDREGGGGGGASEEKRGPPVAEFAPYYATHDGELLGRWGGSHPLQLCADPIDLVERRMCSVLQGFCLGPSPIINDDKASVAAIMHAVVSSNNILVTGPVDSALSEAADEIAAAITSGGGDTAEQNAAEGEEQQVAGGPSSGANGATINLLLEKVASKERDLELLNSTIEKERELLDSTKRQIQKLRYKYSIFD